jgi:hypothetical protein
MRLRRTPFPGHTEDTRRGLAGPSRPLLVLADRCKKSASRKGMFNRPHAPNAISRTDFPVLPFFLPFRPLAACASTPGDTPGTHGVPISWARPRSRIGRNGRLQAFARLSTRAVGTWRARARPRTCVTAGNGASIAGERWSQRRSALFIRSTDVAAVEKQTSNHRLCRSAPSIPAISRCCSGISCARASRCPTASAQAAGTNSQSLGRPPDRVRARGPDKDHSGGRSGPIQVKVLPQRSGIPDGLRASGWTTRSPSFVGTSHMHRTISPGRSDAAQ